MSNFIYFSQIVTCQMHVNFDGHRISRHQLPSKQTASSSEYLCVSSNDYIEILFRQPGGWAFGICRQEDDTER